MAVREKRRREGRGRLSSIELLPEEANPEITWACEELAKRDRTQTDILFELNDRLEAIGCEPISSSSFNRYSIRKAAAFRNLDETTRVSAAVAEALGPDKADHVTVMLVQLVKETAYNILERGSIDTKKLMELSRALNSAVAAEKTSADLARRRQEKFDQDKEKAAQAATDALVKSNPQLDGKKVLAQLREAYGIGAGPAQ